MTGSAPFFKLRWEQRNDVRAPALLRHPALVSSLRLGSPSYLSFTTFLIFTPHLLLPPRASSAAFGGLPLHRCPFFTEIGCPLLPFPPPSLRRCLTASLPLLSLSLSLICSLCKGFAGGSCWLGQYPGETGEEFTSIEQMGTN